MPAGGFDFLGWGICLLFHLQVLHEERPLVGLFLDLNGGGFSAAVACSGLDADHDGRVAGVGFLEGGDELERVGGHDPVVVVGRENQGGRVGGPLFQVVEGGVGVQEREMVGVVRPAVVGGPGPADGELVIPEHVQDTDGRDGRGEEFGPLGHAGTDEEAAVAGPGDGELLARGVALGDQVLGRGDEVVEHVLLLLEDALFVPRHSVLPSAAQAGYGVDAAHLQPQDVADVELGCDADVETAVPVEVGGRVTLERGPFFVREEHGDVGAVLAGVEDLSSFIVVRVELHGGRLKNGRCFRLQVVPVDGRRVGEGGERVEHLGFVLPAADAGHRTEGRQRDFPVDRSALLVHPDDFVGVVHVDRDELVVDDADTREDVGLLGNDLLPVGALRTADVDGDDPELGCVQVGLKIEDGSVVVDEVVAGVEIV